MMWSDIFGTKETGYAAHRDNAPDADFDEPKAWKRIAELEHLLQLAESAGYEFERDDEYGGRIPQDEVRELRSKLFMGPRREMHYAWNDPMMQRMVDQAFAPNPLFQFLRQKLE